MSSRKTAHHSKGRKSAPRKSGTEEQRHDPAGPAGAKKLEIVLKCDTSGCAEAIISAISSLSLPGLSVAIISSGVGAINKSDVFMAETGSRLIVGFNVGLMPHLDQATSEHNVEIRLYDVIYRLLEDIEAIAKSLLPRESQETVIGTAKVVALFKSSRKGIILGCEVLSGKLLLGRAFRVVGAMGPMYTGTIDSLHIEKDAVREATKGQRAGLKIKDFNKARVGDLVESFQVTPGEYSRPWQPSGKIYYP